MSASDDIKAALVAKYPATREKDWKRTSKKIEDGVEVRTFENSAAGLNVTIRDGVIEGSGALPEVEPKAPKAAPRRHQHLPAQSS
jgi:hypothetical protein